MTKVKCSIIVVIRILVLIFGDEVRKRKEAGTTEVHPGILFSTQTEKLAKNLNETNVA